MTKPEKEARAAMADARKAVSEIGAALVVGTVEEIKGALLKVLDAQEKAVDFCSAIEI